MRSIFFSFFSRIILFLIVSVFGQSPIRCGTIGLVHRAFSVVVVAIVALFLLFIDLKFNRNEIAQSNEWLNTRKKKWSDRVHKYSSKYWHLAWISLSFWGRFPKSLCKESKTKQHQHQQQKAYERKQPKKKLVTLFDNQNAHLFSINSICMFYWHLLLFPKRKRNEIARIFVFGYTHKSRGYRNSIRLWNPILFMFCGAINFCDFFHSFNGIFFFGFNIR